MASTYTNMMAEQWRSEPASSMPAKLTLVDALGEAVVGLNAAAGEVRSLSEDLVGCGAPEQNSERVVPMASGHCVVDRVMAATRAIHEAVERINGDIGRVRSRL